MGGLTVRAGQPLYIRVRGRVKPEAAHEAALGTYQLTVSSTAAAPDSEAEPNDSLLSATPVLGSDASGVLSTKRDEDYFLSLIHISFRKPVVPGDQLVLTTSLLRGRGRIWKFRGEVHVAGQLVSEAEFMATLPSTLSQEAAADTERCV